MLYIPLADDAARQTHRRYVAVARVRAIAAPVSGLRRRQAKNVSERLAHTAPVTGMSANQPLAEYRMIDIYLHYS